MKKFILVFTLALAAFHFASAQSAQSVYLELGGPGLVSLNYDTRFKGQEVSAQGLALEQSVLITMLSFIFRWVSTILLEKMGALF